MTHMFDMRCQENDIEHRLTKIKHPWTNGQVERMFEQAASYVDRVLKGAKPGDLPVQLATNYRLIINQKAARAIGIDMPMGLMMRADEVIE
jgi:hypothetical protein